MKISIPQAKTTFPFQKKMLFFCFGVFIVFLGAILMLTDAPARAIIVKLQSKELVKMASGLKKLSSESMMPNYLEEHLPGGQLVRLRSYSGELFFESTGFAKSAKTDGSRLLRYSFHAFDKHFILERIYPDSAAAEVVKLFKPIFFGFGCLLILLYSLMLYAAYRRFSAPICSILQTIRPFREGRVEFLPEIVIKARGADCRFEELSSTLNSLSCQVQSHIEQLLAQKKEHEAILETLSEGIIALDSDNFITYVNEVAAKMLCQSKVLLLGRNFTTLGEDPLPLRCLEICRQSEAKSESCRESIYLEKRGLYLDLTASPKIGGGLILLLQDKTSDSRLIEMGKDFIANAAHELRTPITVIRGFAETLHDMKTVSPSLLKEVLQKILKTSLRLERLVKSLLILSDLDNFKSTALSECDIARLSRRCIEQIKAIFPDARVELLLEGENLLIQAEEDLLEMAIMNLLENAVKYSAHPALISLAVEAKDLCKISITDQGIGIPEEDLAHIFERFYTVDKARSRKMGGAGLGLSIVKTIVERHHGKIDVSSSPEGSSFSLSLPYKGL